MFLKDTSAHKPQLERIVKRSKYLNSRPAAGSDIELGVNNARTRWQKLHLRLDELVAQQSKLAGRAERFDEAKEKVYEFLTEAEIKLIALDPYTSEEPTAAQLEGLKVSFWLPLS